MKSSFDELESGLQSFGNTDPQFRILVFHADELARNQATRLCEQLMENNARSCRLETFCWDLKDPKTIAAVVEAVTMADIIFVAGRDNSELPAELQGALDIGLSTRRVERGALVALLGRADVQQRVLSTLHISLQEKARRTGLKFFPGMFEVPEEKHTYTIDSIHERAERSTPTLKGILNHVVAPVDYANN